ncbi:hypothetical protein V8J36_16905 [Frigidibacter sp. MR17.14]|uniref:hypothetical protein n=1 Tax=Frigidibacter sp. MR17.14 TaxID=3126509 RepID=UPI003012FD4C
MRDLAHPVAMRPVVTDGSAPLPEGLAGAVMLLGSFDGMHRGHAALVAAATAEARRRDAPLAVLQCDPHPRLWFGGPARFRISTGSAQRALLAAAGVGLVYAPRFDAAFAATPAETFVTAILHGRLRLGAVVVGRDFRFGRGREGDVALLSATAARHAIATLVVPDQCEGAGRISSSRVRATLRAGRIAEATRLLGHGWETEITAAGPEFDPNPCRWRFDAGQLLPPPGLWPVAARGAGGAWLGRARLALGPDGLAGAALPPATDRIEWLVPDGPAACSDPLSEEDRR